MNIVIMGGGKVGESLARRILEGRRHEVRIIESCLLYTSDAADE